MSRVQFSFAAMMKVITVICGLFGLFVLMPLDVVVTSILAAIVWMTLAVLFHLAISCIFLALYSVGKTMTRRTPSRNSVP